MRTTGATFPWHGQLARALALLAIFLAWAGSPCHGSAVAVYVDNVRGSDDSLGTQDAPVASFDRAVALLKPSGTLVLANTGKPYRGGIKLIAVGGSPEHPLIVEGNGAVLEGIGATQPNDWQDEGGGIISTKWEANLGFFVVADAAEPKWGKSKTDLEPGESFGDYEAHRGYFRLPPEKSIDNCALEIPVHWNGVMIYDADNIIIRNLHARYFLNDGFNFGGKAENLRFENVEGSHNGDEGFSAHGDAQAYVTDSRFHHNDNGIADTVYSRTGFQRVSIHDNRTMGVWFLGGEHSLVDVKLWSNPTGVVVEPIYPLPLPGHEFHPYRATRVTMRNVEVRDGDSGLKINGDCAVAAEYCTFSNQPVGIEMTSAESRLHMMNSIVQSRELAMKSHGKYFGDYNSWIAAGSEINAQPIATQEWFKQQQIEQHSIFDGGSGIGRAFVDPDYQAWLKSSTGWTSDHPPTQSPNIGADAHGDRDDE